MAVDVPVPAPNPRTSGLDERTGRTCRPVQKVELVRLRSCSRIHAPIPTWITLRTNQLPMDLQM